VTTASRFDPAKRELRMDVAFSGAHVGRLQTILFVLVLGGILTAGLWPFHSPRNDVSWLPSRNGLSFGVHGTILSSGMFDLTNAGVRGPCSLEVWLEPGPTPGGTLLVFYFPRKRRQFSLQQSVTDLLLLTRRGDEQHHIQISQLYVGRVFRQNEQLFITITSDGNEVRVYIDGALAAVDSQLPISVEDLTGELVIANSPVENDSWQGQVLGLALYRQELAPSQVLEHYRTWTRDGRPIITSDEYDTGLYLFDEHQGNIIHNAVTSGVDLYIPERFTVFDEKLLEPAWDECGSGWSYLKNVLINIAGFIPLGFVANALFLSVCKGQRAVLFTILLGFATSLTIEILQTFLPTRDSGTTDLITNTLGTCLGVVVYHYRPVRTLYFEILNYFGSCAFARAGSSEAPAA
jgi:hypothetical protein